MKEGALFFTKDGSTHPMLYGVFESEGKMLYAFLIFSGGCWHEIVKSRPFFEAGKIVYKHDTDYWPVAVGGERMKGILNKELLTVAQRSPDAVSTPYVFGESLENWSVFTCGSKVARNIFRHAPENVCSLLLDGHGIVDANYPSRFSKNDRDCKEVHLRHAALNRRLLKLMDQHDDVVETDLLKKYESIVLPLDGLSQTLPAKIKAAKAFVRNTRKRAVKNAMTVGNWWVKGYTSQPPSEAELLNEYVRRLDIEVQRSHKSIEMLGATTVSRLTKLDDAIKSLGPLILKSVAISCYKIKNQALQDGKRNGTLRGVQIKNQWLWAQNDIRKLVGANQLRIQQVGEIPIVNRYEDVHSVCEHLAKLFDQTCVVDISFSVDLPYNFTKSLKSNRRRIRNGSCTCSRYFVRDILSFFKEGVLKQQPTLKKMGSVIAKTMAGKDLALLSKPGLNEETKRTHLTIVTSSEHSEGYHDFLSEVDLTNIHHELVFVGAREDAILKHIQNRSFVAGDIICVIRGGGDLLHPTFKPFDHHESAVGLRNLREKGVIVVTGVGHSRDRVVIDRAATYAESTPIKAGQRVSALLQHVDVSKAVS